MLIANSTKFMNGGLIRTLGGLHSGGSHAHPSLSVSRVFRCSISASGTLLSSFYERYSFIFGLTKMGEPGSSNRFVGKGFNFTSRLLRALRGRNGHYPIVLSDSVRTALINECTGSICKRSGLHKRRLFFSCTTGANTGIFICHFPGLFKG